MTQPEELKLVCQVSEISALLAGSADVDSFLSSIVGLVATHLSADVCSIYLYDEDTDQLVLQVNQGLNPGVVGNVRLGPGEGLVGQALQTGQTICEPVASRHPAYRFVSDSAEENFESFLAVPVRRGIEAIGVVVVQREQSRPFQESEVMALQARASMLASSIENARLLGAPRALPSAGGGAHSKPRRERALPDRLRGRVASPGTVLGPSRRWRTRARCAGVLAARQNPELDVEALQRAVAATAGQLDALQQQFESRLPEMEALIFTAQQLMLRDPGFLGRMTAQISPERDAAAAVVSVAQEVCDELGQSPHAYIREKADDVRDLADRLLDHLLGAWDASRPAYEGAIVLARDLWPTDVLRLSTERVGGLVANRGGATGHTAILARSLGIPMLIVEDPQLLDIPQGSELLLDADGGLLLCEPDATARDRYAAALQAHADSLTPPAWQRDSEPPASDDAVTIRAEINLLGELDAARRVGADGIGLYRTEYPFLARRNFPSEQEQVGIYRRLFDAMPKQTVTVRTLDVGGDKTLRYFTDDSEDNPALGLRAIRFSLRFPGIFRDQLRAILRAGADAKELRILLPMITALEEVTASRELLDRCREELRQEGVRFNDAPLLGVLVETPAALEIGPELAEHADFFSIGSNDLAQYMLAIDRSNQRLADRLDTTHPAVLRAIGRFVDAVRPFDREISICGKMAIDPEAIPKLLAMGIRHFVAPPHLVRSTRAVIREARG